MTEIKRDLTRTTLAVLFIVALIVASFWIVWPFLSAALWATMIVFVTWPMLRWIQSRLGNSRMLAVAVMIAALLVVLVFPLTLAIISIVGEFDQIAIWAESLASYEIPPPPPWLGQLPIVGEAAMRAWEQARLEISELLLKAAPYLLDIAKWLISTAGGFVGMLVQFLVTALVAAFLYAKGEIAAAALRRFGHRLAGERGEMSVYLAGQAVRGVAFGVVVTALVQAILGGVGLVIAGVPFAAFLTAAIFILCIAQLGPVLVLLPAAVWMYWNGDAGWGTFLLIWTIPVVVLDNFLRVVLIKKGADLPLPLIFVGVIGGLIGFGLGGLFVGPVILSVAYTLLAAWVAEEPEQAKS